MHRLHVCTPPFKYFHDWQSIETSLRSVIIGQERRKSTEQDFSQMFLRVAEVLFDFQGDGSRPVTMATAIQTALAALI